MTSPEFRHVPIGTLAVLAQRLGKVWASPSTWYHLVRKYGWRRPRLRVHPAKPKVGLRTTRADEMWHIDTTVRRLVAFYVDEHHRVLPHSAYCGQAPDEMYFGTGDAVPADLTSRAVAGTPVTR